MKAASTILTVLAIIGGLAAGALWYLVKGQKEALIDERNGLQAAKTQLETDKTNLTQQVDDLTSRNGALSSELGEVKTRNTTLESRTVQLTRDLAQSRANAETALSDARKATEESANLRRKVLEITSTIEGIRAESESEIVQLRDELTRLKTLGITPSSAVAEGEKVPLINTSVASVGPRSAFVVINAGSTQGLRSQMKLAINRGGEIVAQAYISELKDNLAVAQIIPNTLVKAPRAGDDAYTVR